MVESNPMKKQTIAKISAVIITIVLIVVLLTQIEIGEIVSLLWNIDPLYLAAGFVFYIISSIFRALRFKILLDNRIDTKDLFAIVCVHNMVNNIMPARLGELSYVYLAKKKHGVSTGEGIATLLVARVFDFITISLLFFLAASSISDLPHIISQATRIAMIFIIILVLLLVALVHFKERSLRSIRSCVTALRIQKYKPIDYILRKTEETVESFNIIRSSRVILYVFILSILIWLSFYSIIYLLTLALGIEITIMRFIVGATIYVFTTVLPIQSIIGFGTIEAGWAAGFIAVGVPMNIAIGSGFAIHIIGIVFFMITGAYGLLKCKR